MKYVSIILKSKVQPCEEEKIRIGQKVEDLMSNLIYAGPIKVQTFLG